MGSVGETVKTINSTLRTVMMLVLLVAGGWAGYLGYALVNEPQQKLAEQQAAIDKALVDLRQAQAQIDAGQKEIAELEASLREKSAEVVRLAVAMKLLKVRRRLARLTVLDQREEPASNQPTTSTNSGDESAEATADASTDDPSRAATTAPATQLVSTIEFVEVNDEGNPIGPTKQFKITGDMVYIDYLRVTFDDKYIESSDLDRSTAIALFQRIFGEHQEAARGYQLDEVGTRPTAYARGTDMSEFERKIWDDFWLIANNPAKAAELGIHAAHGSAVSMRVQPGKTYEIELRSTGDITLRPVEDVDGLTP